MLVPGVPVAIVHENRTTNAIWSVQAAALKPNRGEGGRTIVRRAAAPFTRRASVPKHGVQRAK
jgi:hypothetical protein